MLHFVNQLFEQITVSFGFIKFECIILTPS